jgi:hypothetical protein
MVTFAKVQSDYWTNNPGSEERLPKAQAAIPVLTFAQAAGAILQGLESDRERIVEPFMLRLVLSWARWFPAAGRKFGIDFGEFLGKGLVHARTEAPRPRERKTGSHRGWMRCFVMEATGRVCSSTVGYPSPALSPAHGEQRNERQDNFPGKTEATLLLYHAFGGARKPAVPPPTSKCGQCVSLRLHHDPSSGPVASRLKVRLLAVSCPMSRRGIVAGSFGTPWRATERGFCLKVGLPAVLPLFFLPAKFAQKGGFRRVFPPLVYLAQLFKDFRNRLSSLGPFGAYRNGIVIEIKFRDITEVIPPAVLVLQKVFILFLVLGDQFPDETILLVLHVPGINLDQVPAVFEHLWFL